MKTTTATHASPGWRRLPPLPDKEGFAGSFAGISNNALLVAGGANFPGKRPWEGGVKRWYDSVFALEPGATQWRAAGRLPAANGYGVSATCAEGVVLVGGGDSREAFAEVWLARWDGQAVVFTSWPALPKPLVQAAGALVGRILYVAGGIDRPAAGKAQQTFFALDLDRWAEGWRTLAPCPGAERILAVAAAQEDEFYFFWRSPSFVRCDGPAAAGMAARRLALRAARGLAPPGGPAAAGRGGADSGAICCRTIAGAWWR